LPRMANRDLGTGTPHGAAGVVPRTRSGPRQTSRARPGTLLGPSVNTGARAQRERSYTLDAGLDREALLSRNIAVLLAQGATPAEAAAFLRLPLGEVKSRLSASSRGPRNAQTAPDEPEGGDYPGSRARGVCHSFRAKGVHTAASGRFYRPPEAATVVAGKEAEMPASRKKVAKGTRQEPIVTRIGSVEVQVWTRGSGQLSLRRMDLDKAASFWPRTTSEDLREQFLNAAERAGFDAEEADAAARNLSFSR
jgi:hypothetical protein